MLRLLRSLLDRALSALAWRLSGKCQDEDYTSQLVHLDDDEVIGELPIGTPVVTFSSRAIEMQTASNRYHASLRAQEVKPVPAPPRVGSRDWRLAEAKAGR